MPCRISDKEANDGIDEQGELEHQKVPSQNGSRFSYRDFLLGKGLGLNQRSCGFPIDAKGLSREDIDKGFSVFVVFFVPSCQREDIRTIEPQSNKESSDSIKNRQESCFTEHFKGVDRVVPENVIDSKGSQRKEKNPVEDELQEILFLRLRCSKTSHVFFLLF